MEKQVLVNAESLQKILEHVYDEGESFVSFLEDGGNSSDHIYHHVVIVSQELELSKLKEEDNA